MTQQIPDKITISLNGHDADDLQKRDDAKFRTEIEQLTREAENIRLRYMKQHESRQNVLLLSSIICMTLAVIAFGWLFLMESSLLLGLAAFAVCLLPPALPYFRTKSPPKRYRKAFKAEFLPQLAHALGGLKYFKTRGISEKVVRRTGVIPSYALYKAEDCFAGHYKGVKVILSEARLYGPKGKGTVFDGLFVLMEIPDSLIEGHTIITSNMEQAARWRKTRWKKLQDVSLNLENPQANRFNVYSDSPDSASLIVGERLLKELGEMEDIFDKAHLNAVLFKGKYIFISIPCADDMFEPSDLDVPIATSQHALQCKREIEKIMELIDIFELFNTSGKDFTPQQKS